MQVSRPLSDPNPRSILASRLLFEWQDLVESVGRQNCRVKVAGKLPLPCDLHSTSSLDARVGTAGHTEVFLSKVWRGGSRFASSWTYLFTVEIHDQIYLTLVRV